MIVDVILGLLVLIYSIMIKRADRLAPESSGPDDISKAKNKDLEAEHLTENEAGEENQRVWWPWQSTSSSATYSLFIVS